MIFAILFVVVFLIGAACYWLTRNWMVGTMVTSLLFVTSVFLDVEASQYWTITLIFGLPIVFVAALLGAYVVEQRLYPAEEDEPTPSASSDHGAPTDKNLNTDQENDIDHSDRRTDS
ncbi:MAG: hypothetical protein AAF197_02450 [Pseudomonadota bacterium]